MTVCKFFRQGHCNRGNSCRFEHPAALAPQQQGQIPNNAPKDPRGAGPPVRDYRDNRNTKDPNPYGVTRNIIEDDLRRERPIWIMSGYSPGKDPDIQLFGGFPLEQSQEEIRTLHYQAIASGNVQQSAQMEAELAAKSNEQVQAVLNDISGALHYLANGRNQHPNRNDICKAGTSVLQKNGNGPFSRSSRQHRQRSGFGTANAPQPSKSGIQQQQQPQVGFGQSPQSTPNNPSTFPNSASPSGFGVVNQPTSFGQPPQPQIQPQPTPFGQPTAGGYGNQPAVSGFGTPNTSILNQQSGQSAIGFGQQPNGNNTFGQTQLQPQNGPFDQQGVQPMVNGVFGNPQQAPTQDLAPFGAQVNQGPSQQNSGVFGQPQIAQNSGVAMTNGFGMAQLPQQQQQQGEGGFGAAPSAAFGDVQSYTTRDASNKLLTWKGRPVDYMNGDHPCYQRDDGSWERIWFPDGPPANSANGAAGANEYPGMVKDAFGVLKDSGKFKDGLIPDIAPSAEMVGWDL